MSAFAAGLIVAGFALAGLFFLAFSRQTRDSFFAAFAAAFWLMALNRALTALLGVPREEQSWIYVLRLAAFLIILVAVVGKNFGSRRPRLPAAETERSKS